MLFQIIRDNPKPRVIQMGGSSVPVPEPEQPKAMAAAVPIPTAPKQTTANQGRQKKMAKEKDLDEVGTKTIREDDAGEKGAIGSHGKNAPAQEKVPEKSEGSKGGSND